MWRVTGVLGCVYEIGSLYPAARARTVREVKCECVRTRSECGHQYAQQLTTMIRERVPGNCLVVDADLEDCCALFRKDATAGSQTLQVEVSAGESPGQVCSQLQLRRWP